jgi:hypothetical protein
MTAAQALENAKGMTFEKFWASLMEDRKQKAEEDERYRKQKAEEDDRYRKQKAEDREQLRLLRESQAETSAQMREQMRVIKESQAKTDKQISELTMNIGGLNNTLGGIIEDMFTPQVLAKFSLYGYTFTKCARDLVFRNEAGRKIAEVDAFLENGNVVMGVEVKSKLRDKDVNEHVERLDVIRAYMDERHDRRILVGAMAGGFVKEAEKRYAEENGLYVLTQNGSSIEIAEEPGEFKPREWK